MKNVRFNTASTLDLGCVKDKYGDPITTIPLTSLNLKITAKNKNTGAVTIISNATASSSGSYPMNYLGGTNNLFLSASAALLNQNAELTFTITNASMIELEDIYNIVPQVVYDAMQLGISQIMDIGQ